MNRRNLLLGTAGLAVGIAGCSKSSNGPSQVSAKKITLKDCPALKAYIDSLCNIPGGTFMQGSDEFVEERPVHKVRISAFRMGKTPVTIAMWEEFFDHGTGSLESFRLNADARGDDYPVIGVTWDECKEFASWASEISGVKLSLPSEAQWEYACRGGRDGLNFPWGDDFDRSKVWCSDEKLGDRGSTGSVIRTVYIWRDHPWGLIDMVGNVREWCEDWYDPKWYEIPQASEKDVVNLESSPIVKLEYTDGTSEELPVRCNRGGSWKNFAPGLFRCAYRSYCKPASRYEDLGFRLSAGPR